MINAWQWEKSKVIAFPACKCKSRLNFRVRDQFEINILKVRLMKHDLFHMHFKKIELGPAIIWKVATCQRIPSKITRTQRIDTWARDTVRRYWSAETLFWQLSINQNMDVQYQVAGSQTVARKCEIKHWYACGAEGRKVGWSAYGHVIAEFSRMDRFSIKVWGFELSPWSNKISAQNFKHYVTSIDRKMSPRSTQVMMVSVYSSLRAVN